MEADGGLGIFLTALPPPLALTYAERAESAGFDSAWFPEITFGDSFCTASAAAQRTSRVGIATGVVGIWSRSPVTMALQAATLHQLSGERLILGLGVQARGYVQGWHGQRYQKPVTAMREFLTILRSILARENTTFEGEVFSVRNFQLQMEPPQRPIELYVAANGPKMIQLAGELADGTVGYFHSVEYVRDVVVPNVRIGAERVGRTRDEVTVTCGFPAVLTEDDESGIAGARGQVVMYATALGSAPAYADSIAVAGFGAAGDEIRARVAAGDLPGAVAAVPDEMADALTLSGSAENVRRRIERYREAGLDAVHLNPSAPGAYFPLYEGHFPQESLAGLPPFDFPRFLEVVDRSIELGPHSP